MSCYIVSGLLFFLIAGSIMTGIGAADYARENREIRAGRGDNGTCLVLHTRVKEMYCYDGYYYRACGKYFSVIYTPVDYDNEQKQVLAYGTDGLDPSDFKVDTHVECWSNDFENATVVVWRRDRHNRKTTNIFGWGVAFLSIVVILAVAVAIVFVM